MGAKMTWTLGVVIFIDIILHRSGTNLLSISTMQEIINKSYWKIPRTKSMRGFLDLTELLCGESKTSQNYNPVTYKERREKNKKYFYIIIIGLICHEHALNIL